MKAIRHACNKWKVDIISISLGFPYLTEALRDAIEETRDKVLIFAAASNDGANKALPIAFPARAPGVFCVHSTDALGKPSSFTPFPQKYVDNFATLGEEVRSAWPKHMRRGLEQRMSGTSVATPIAASIAAQVLEYGRNELDDEEKRLLRSHDGMREVLLEMATDAGGYWYLNPTEFFQGQVDEDGKTKKALPRIKEALSRVQHRASQSEQISASSGGHTWWKSFCYNRSTI